MNVSAVLVVRCHNPSINDQSPRFRASARQPASTIDIGEQLSKLFDITYPASPAMSEVQKKLQELSDSYQKLQGGMTTPNF